MIDSNPEAAPGRDAEKILIVYNWILDKAALPRIASKLQDCGISIVDSGDVAPIADIANANICMSLCWSGDIETAQNRAEKAKTGAKIAYPSPREGGSITLDAMAICRVAPHPHNAEVWMNYLMRPGVIAGITNAI